ncbi:hypothetical protein BGX28_004338 [Mortierella sp. GBA30]|nr:hypothetical protein BGX28_004338 [Mortierella sp. GBA30]
MAELEVLVYAEMMTALQETEWKMLAAVLADEIAVEPGLDSRGPGVGNVTRFVLLLVGVDGIARALSGVVDGEVKAGDTGGFDNAIDGGRAKARAWIPCALAGGSVGGVLRAFGADVPKGVEFAIPVGVPVHDADGGRGGLGEDGEVKGDAIINEAPGEAPPGPDPGPGPCPRFDPLPGADRPSSCIGCLGLALDWI